MIAIALYRMSTIESIVTMCVYRKTNLLGAFLTSIPIVNVEWLQKNTKTILKQMNLQS